MTIINAYSKRQRKIRGETNDVYQHNNTPYVLRVQIIKAMTDSIDLPPPNERYTSYKNEADKVYTYTHEILSKEYGALSLKEFAENDLDVLASFFPKEGNIEKCLDFIEICFQILVSRVAKSHYEFEDITSQSPGDAVIKLNERFREHGVGYQLKSEEIIRTNSQLIRADIVEPTLIPLSGEPLSGGANSELLAVYEHYRYKRYKECLDGCLKPFESTMRAIHDKNNWKYSPNDTISRLVNSCLSQNLVPAYLQSQFISLKTMLETGIPTIRSENAGHGQEVDVKKVPEELASYMLHLTTTSLLFPLKHEKNIE